MHVELSNRKFSCQCRRHGSRAAGGTEPWSAGSGSNYRCRHRERPVRMEVAGDVSLPPAVVVAVHAVPRETLGSGLRRANCSGCRPDSGTGAFQTID